MIRLHPLPQNDHRCPHCRRGMETLGWYMPGMRMLADLRCDGCGRRYYGDLPAGHGLGYPALLDQATGEVHHRDTLVVFADYLRDSYAARVGTAPRFEAESFRPLRRPVLLNCLDWVFGHALLKLLYAQYYLDRPDEFDLIVMVPRPLRWLVPDGVAEVWTVDLPFSRGAVWNDGLAAEIRRRIEPLEECLLSFAFGHPHPDDFDIERFSRVTPFPLERWAETLERPVVTYAWREDRGWGPEPGASPLARLRRGVRRAAGLHPVPNTTLEQVVKFAEHLRADLPTLDFAVAGLGGGGPLPQWIVDLRRERPDDRVEREWCERFARSHVAVGVHGSHMLLPTAHAGALVQLVTHNRWDSRWGNLIQDVLVRGSDARDVLYRHRFLPADTSPEHVATITAALIRFLPTVALNFGRDSTDHEALARRWAGLPREYAAVSC